jgi:hypothetical protein
LQTDGVGRDGRKLDSDRRSLGIFLSERLELALCDTGFRQLSDTNTSLPRRRFDGSTMDPVPLRGSSQLRSGFAYFGELPPPRRTGNPAAYQTGGTQTVQGVTQPASCWRCGEPVREPGYCSGCRSDIARERIWEESGFPPPFDPDFAKIDRPPAEQAKFLLGACSPRARDRNPTHGHERTL